MKAADHGRTVFTYSFRRRVLAGDVEHDQVFVAYDVGDAVTVVGDLHRVKAAWSTVNKRWN